MDRFYRPNVVISQCLEFGPCRFDGSQINSCIIKKLKEHIKFLPVCPEMAIGLPSPRQALRITIDEVGNESLIYSKTGEDITDQMKAFVKKEVEKIQTLNVDGFILKTRSPSCGMKDVKVYKTYGKSPSLQKKTKGFFGRAIKDAFGNLAIEDEGRLLNYHIREHFYTQLYTLSSFRHIKEEPSMDDLIKFHSINKYLFMAYQPNHLKVLERLVSNHNQKSIEKIIVEYEEVLGRLLNTFPKPLRFVNVMLHIFGYFSKDLNAKEKAFFLDTLDQYRQAQVPQSTVMAILKSWVIRFNDDYLMDQSIFEPFPSPLIEMTDSGKGAEKI